MNYILRMRGLGGVSCPAIAAAMEKDCFSVVNPSTHDESVVFRWGCTITLNGTPRCVVNDASSIHLGANKKASRLKLQAEGVFVPESWEANDAGALYAGCPLIVRPEQHSQGRELFYCTSLFEVQRAQEQIGGSNYISRYIPKVREYRVYVVCGRVVAVADKLPDDPSAIAWNHSQGSSYRNIKWSSWPLSGCYEACKATEIIGLDFAGVDVMEDAEGRVYVLELNSAPSLLSDYRTRCMANAFDYIVENGKAHIPLGPDANWRSFIHPAILEKS